MIKKSSIMMLSFLISDELFMGLYTYFLLENSGLLGYFIDEIEFNYQIELFTSILSSYFN